MADDVELLVAGGGLVGLLLAIACAGAGLAVALVDRQEPRAMQEDAFDGRSSAIAYGSRRVLEGLGVWSAIAPDAEPILEIRVADDNAPLFLHYDHRDLGGDAPLGYIVENRVLRRALFAHAAALPNLLLVAPVSVVRAEAAPGGTAALLSDGRRLAARLVAACDGRGSPLRRAAPIRTLEWRYPQTGIVVTVRHEKPHRGIAVEHFLPAGPFAILPMTDDPAVAAPAFRARSSIVWTERAALAPRILALDETGFAAELAARFGDFLGALAPVGPRWSYPLALMQAERLVAPRLALVGEAAHLVHPIAGQGLNLSIRDVAVLSELVVDARRLGLDIGEAGLLRQYQRRRQVDTLLLAAVTDGLNRLFSNDLPPLRLVRDLGLAAVDRLPPVKRFLMRDAMGLTGDLPRLVRGEPL